MLVYNPFRTLLNLVCLSFVKYFCIYVQKGYWFVVFSLFGVYLGRYMTKIPLKT